MRDGLLNKLIRGHRHRCPTFLKAGISAQFRSDTAAMNAGLGRRRRLAREGNGGVRPWPGRQASPNSRDVVCRVLSVASLDEGLVTVAPRERNDLPHHIFRFLEHALRREFLERLAPGGVFERV